MLNKNRKDSKDDKNLFKNKDNFMLYVPKIKHNNWEVKEGKVLLIFYHNKPIEKFMRWLIKKSNTSDIELDEMGSAVWQFIDGDRTVYDISLMMKEKFDETEEVARERLIPFLRYLCEKGWIAFKK